MDVPCEPNLGHSDDWVSAFTSQLTDALCVELREYARRRSRKMGSSHADGLVQDAIGKTWEGRLRWDPTRIDLRGHLRRAIRCAARHIRKRGERFPHVAIDSVRLRKKSCDTHTRDLANAGLRELRRLACGLPNVLLLLDAYERQAFDRSDVMELTGLTLHQYEAAHEQLCRVRKRLPNYLAQHRQHGAPGRRPPEKNFAFLRRKLCPPTLLSALTR